MSTIIKTLIINLLTFSTIIVTSPAGADNISESENKQVIIQIGIGNTAIQESRQNNRSSINQAQQTDFINIQTNNQNSPNSLSNHISVQRSVNYSGRGSYSNYRYNGRCIYCSDNRTKR